MKVKVYFKSVFVNEKINGIFFQNSKKKFLKIENFYISHKKFEKSSFEVQIFSYLVHIFQFRVEKPAKYPVENCSGSDSAACRCHLFPPYINLKTQPKNRSVQLHSNILVSDYRSNVTFITFFEKKNFFIPKWKKN